MHVCTPARAQEMDAWGEVAGVVVREGWMGNVWAERRRQRQRAATTTTESIDSKQSTMSNQP